MLQGAGCRLRALCAAWRVPATGTCAAWRVPATGTLCCMVLVEGEGAGCRLWALVLHGGRRLRVCTVCTVCTGTCAAGAGAGCRGSPVCRIHLECLFSLYCQCCQCCAPWCKYTVCVWFVYCVVCVRWAWAGVCYLYALSAHHQQPVLQYRSSRQPPLRPLSLPRGSPACSSHATLTATSSSHSLRTISSLCCSTAVAGSRHCALSRCLAAAQPAAPRQR